MNQTNSIAGLDDRHRRTRLSEGYAAVFATVLIWSTPSLFMYYLNRYYDPWAQNFYRYFVACLAIAPLVFYRIRRGGPEIDLRAVGLCLLPCLPNVVHQVTQVMALFYMGPGVYTIFIRSSVIFTALLALAFFPEERFVIRQWKFQAGTLLGLIGAFGVIWFQPDVQSQQRHIALPGLFIAFAASFCWALYGVLIKRPSAQLGSIRSFGLVSFITSALLFPLTLGFGKIDTPLHAGADVNVILVIRIAAVMRGWRSLALMNSKTTSAPSAFEASPAWRLSSTSHAGTKSTQRRLLSRVPCAKAGARRAATIAPRPVAGTPAARPGLWTNSLRRMC